MRVFLVGFAIVLASLTVALGEFAPAARAADRDCADFSSQRAAQDYFISKGGPASDPDRLDADHDGVACESNPCPCGRTPAAQPRPRAAPRPRPRPLPSLFTGRCHRGVTPDRHCTPGAVAPGVDAQTLCSGGYRYPGRIASNLIHLVFLDYGVRRNLGRYAIDRLVPTALGGTNSRRNLWAQGVANQYIKASIGLALRQGVCAARITLADARRRIANDWRRALAGSGIYFFNARQGYLDSPAVLDFCSSGCEYQQITWSGWHSDITTGNGYYAPVVSGEVQGYYPVTLTLSEPRTCANGIRIYTRLTEDYPGDVPTSDFQRHAESHWLCNGQSDTGF
jgi:Excalibur calcium-binding domain